MSNIVVAIGVSALSFTVILAATLVVLVAAMAILRQRARRTTPESDDPHRGEPRPSPAKTDGLADIRPKLLLDAVFLPTETGAYFRSRRGVFTLDGKQTYGLFSQLIPHLVGQETMAEICSGLDETDRQPAKALITTLLEKGVVVNHLDEVTDLGDAVLGRFAPQIEFIEHFADRPVKRFSEFRHSSVALMGSGVPLKSLALSIARNGAGRILLEAGTPHLEEDSELIAVMQSLTEEGVDISTERFDLSALFGGSSSRVKAVCYAADVADLHELASLNRRFASLDADMAFLPGILFGGKALIGPLVRNAKPACWMCALLRYSENAPPELAAELWRHMALNLPWTNDGQPASSPSLKIMGNMMGFEVFRLIVGHIPIETDSSVISIDLQTLESEVSPVLPYPGCPDCSRAAANDDREFLSRALAEPASRPLPPQQKLKLVAPSMNPLFGILREFDDDDLPQIPLFQSSVRFAKRGGADQNSISGYSIQTNLHARADAALNALRLYAPSVPSTGRLWSGSADAARESGFNVLADHTLSNHMGGLPPDDLKRHWSYVRSLSGGTLYLANAGAVYAKSNFNNDSYFEKNDIGVGVGFTFREACADAILALFAQELLKRVATGQAHLRSVSADALSETNASLRYLRNVLNNLGCDFRLLAFTHEGSGTLAVAFTSGDASCPERMAVGVAGALPAAVVSSLTELLTIVQGGKSVRTAAHYLPAMLGYQLDLSDADQGSHFFPLAPSNDQSMYSALFAFGGAFSDIVVANITNEDLRRCGLFAVRALFVRL